ncbi:MAG: DNA mismatch repair endonuclease MutL [Tannerellaceae bacterium]|jgi:DNA mismatch repair protein MutL|nr:DNA mismatch repair endonuclease MutL [Tannerellaceae bacterium]
MSDIIHLLPDSIANQIAAGEVIQRPASVVKELVENAVDAGATQIQVNIKDAGRTLIQVTDDGKGMSETDARMAFERHATSKISSANDLFSLTTMGFRGEALASIAAVAHVELRTRQKGNELGSRLTIIGSVVEESTCDACGEGSIFSVKNIFFNVPARRKFLKSNETEFRNIVQEFERIALVNPHIALSLYHQDAEVLNLPASGLRQRIINIFGKGLNDKLLTLEANSSLATVSGFVGRPDSAKKRSSLQYFFVNGRYMRHPYFHKAVMQAYDRLIPPGEMPSYFIYFTLDPASIDVNIHPTKTEIKFENEQPLWQILMSSVREALAKSSAIPTIDFNREDAIDIPVYTPEKEETGTPPPTIQVNRNYNPFRSAGSGYHKRQEFDWAQLYTGFDRDAELESTITPAENDLFGTEETAEPVSPQIFFDKKSVSSYQYKDQYIITSLKSGLIIIDQHRAHVRVLYDRYMDMARHQQGISQQLLFPEIVEFTPAEASVVPVLLDDLHYMGFDLSDLGQGSYAINGVPPGIEGLEPAGLLKEMVARSMDTGCEVREEISHALSLSLSKSAAIPAGKSLSPEERDHLIASLFSATDSHLTPDGKTILSLLTDEELNKRFR